jgi:uncharacterized membrane protein
MFERSETAPLLVTATEALSEEIALDDEADRAITAEDIVEAALGVRATTSSAGDADAGSAATTLPVPAAVAFDAFCDVSSIPRWVSVIHSVHVQERTAKGRPRSASFLARLERASIGYTTFYEYDEADRIVTWRTPPASSTKVSGRVQFVPLGDRACLMQYELHLELPGLALPPWEDPFFSGHAASVVMNDFRDFVIRSRSR